MTMSVSGFDLLTFEDDGTYVPRRVDLPKLTAEPRLAVGEILLKVIDALKKRWESHKARFCMKKLAQFFPDTMSYFCQKVSEGVDVGSVAGAASLSAIKDAFSGFQAADVERNPNLAQHLADEYATIDHAIAGLELFLGAIAHPCRETAVQPPSACRRIKSNAMPAILAYPCGEVKRATLGRLFQRATGHGGDAAAVLGEAQHAAERLKPPWIREPTQHFGRPELLDNGHRHRSGELRHPLEEPGRGFSRVQRQLGNTAFHGGIVADHGTSGQGGSAMDLGAGVLRRA